MRIHIKKEVFLLLRQNIFHCLKNYIEKKGENVLDLSETAIWNFDMEVGNNLSSKPIKAMKLMLGDNDIGTSLFQTPLRYFKNEEDKAFDGNKLKIYLNYLGYNDPTPIEQVKSFIEKNEAILTPVIISEQKKLINASPNAILRPIEGASPNISKWKINLSNTLWYLYFYGYKHKDEPKDEESWSLIKLVLKFGRVSKKSKNIKIEIQNTQTVNHHSYIGTTDFLMSGQKVLIMNLRTVDDKYRHLHIKIHVDDEAKGDFFLGQYLNYGHEEDQIWSGSVILEKFNGRHPFPFVYNFKKGICNEINDISHLVDFFSDKVMNFRRTTKQVHSRQEFEEWKKTRKNSTAQ
jgi:hypothetical protein